MEQINKQLKECPCCKGKTSIHKRHDYLTGSNWIKIQCNDCLLQSEEINIDINFGHSEDIEYVNNMINELVTRWNTRKPMEHITKRLEETKTKRFVTGITANPYEFGACHAMDIAINIVKEEME